MIGFHVVQYLPGSGTRQQSDRQIVQPNRLLQRCASVVVITYPAAGFVVEGMRTNPSCGSRDPLAQGVVDVVCCHYPTLLHLEAGGQEEVVPMPSGRWFQL